MATAIFGKPETGGVVFDVTPERLEQATILYRAIHTLELLGEHGIIEDDDSIASCFVAQSWRELRYLLEQTGVHGKDIDIGEFFR